MPTIPSPGDLANAGGWAVAVFVLLAVLAAGFWLLRELFRREFRRSDALAEELRATKLELSESNVERLRLRRVIDSYETGDRQLGRARGRRQDADDE